jgi:hypothetical protein
LGDQHAQRHRDDDTDDQGQQHPADDLVAEGGGIRAPLDEHDSSHPSGPSLDQDTLTGR